MGSRRAQAGGLVARCTLVKGRRLHTAQPNCTALHTRDGTTEAGPIGTDAHMTRHDETSHHSLVRSCTRPRLPQHSTAQRPGDRTTHQPHPNSSAVATRSTQQSHARATTPLGFGSGALPPSQRFRLRLPAVAPFPSLAGRSADSANSSLPHGSLAHSSLHRSVGTQCACPLLLLPQADSLTPQRTLPASPIAAHCSRDETLQLSSAQLRCCARPVSSLSLVVCARILVLLTCACAGNALTFCDSTSLLSPPLPPCPVPCHRMSQSASTRPPSTRRASLTCLLPPPPRRLPRSHRRTARSCRLRLPPTRGGSGTS